MPRLVMRIVLALVGAAALAGAVVWIALRPPPPLRPVTAAFTLAPVTIVNPGGGRRAAQALTVADGVIRTIAAAATPPRDPALARYAGAYVLPGLADLHTHLPPANALRLTGYFALLYLAHGVTSVRDAGDVDGTAVPAARDGIARHRFPGPRVFACGPFIAGGEPRWANTVVLHAPEEADGVVARLKRDGFDCVKSYDDLTVEEIRALVAAGAKYGLPVIGHVPRALAYEDALVPNVQHLFGVPPPASLARDHLVSRAADWQDVDDARMALIVRTTLAHGIINTPTLVHTQQLLLYADYPAARADPIVRLMPRLYRDVVWHPDEGIPVYRHLGAADLERLRDALAKKKELVRRLHAAGAALQIGTDVQQPFVVPGASVHQEMRLFVEAGLSAEETWEIATRKAGEALGIPLLGTIEAGAPADLILFRDDPTRSLAALATLEAVVAQGRLYTREDMEREIAAYQRHFDGMIFDRLSTSAARRILRRAIHTEH